MGSAIHYSPGLHVTTDSDVHLHHTTKTAVSDRYVCPKMKDRSDIKQTDIQYNGHTCMQAEEKTKVQHITDRMTGAHGKPEMNLNFL